MRSAFLRRSATPHSMSRGHAKRSFGLNLKTTGELLSEFSGSVDSYDAWSKKVELVRDSYAIEDNALKVLISTKLKGQALSWFHSRPEHIMLSVTELMNRMKAMFDHRPNKLSLRHKFEKRRWNPNEPFSDYHCDKIILANRVPILDEETIDYIVDGIPDFRLRNQAISE